MYQNAQKGIKNIFISTIIELIVAVLTVPLAIMAIFALDQANQGNESSAIFSLSITGVLTFIVFALSIVALVLTFVGISQARKDEESFKIPLIMAIVAIILSVIAGFMKVGYFRTIISTASSILTFLTNCYIIISITKIFARLNDEMMVRRGKTLLYILLIGYVLEVVLDLVSSITKASVNQVVGSILTIVVLGLTVFTAIFFMVYLNQSSTRLNGLNKRPVEANVYTHEEAEDANVEEK